MWRPNTSAPSHTVSPFRGGVGLPLIGSTFAADEAIHFNYVCAKPSADRPAPPSTPSAPQGLESGTVHITDSTLDMELYMNSWF